MPQFAGIFDSSKLEIATLFKVVRTSNSTSNTIHLDKYDFEAKDSFLLTSNISSAEQLKHALKSRQDKVNFFKNNLVTMASYCFCVYHDRRLIKPTHDVLAEVAEIMRSAAMNEKIDRQAETETKLLYIIPIHDLITIEDEEASSILQLEFDLVKEDEESLHDQRSAEDENKDEEHVFHTKRMESTNRRESSRSDSDMQRTDPKGASSSRQKVNQDNSDLKLRPQATAGKKEAKLYRIPFYEFVQQDTSPEA